ncbi:MAG TPA: carbohydrate porin [Lacunisphaera sp.]
MKSLVWTSSRHLLRHSRKLSAGLILLGLVTVTTNLAAQSVISTPSGPSYTPPALPQGPATDSILPGFLETSLFQWGPVTIHPHLSYRFLYGDGVQANPGQQKKTSVNTISLGLLGTLGTHWSLDYTPSKTFYSNSAFSDSFNQSLSLLGGTTFEKWTFQVGQTYLSSTTPLIETGRQTKEDSYGTNASADYRFTDRIQLDTALGYQVRSTEDFNNSKDSTITERLHYQFSDRVDTSVNLGYGYSKVSLGPDMTFTRPAATATWKPTEKVSLAANIGYEVRRFRTGGAGDLKTPTFDASMNYRPFSTTSISFSTTRGVSTSYFSNQVTRDTSWTVGFNQRLLQHYYLSADYSGQKSSYISTDPSLTVGRDDRNYNFNVSLSTALFQRATVSVLYQNTHNTSNDLGFGFTSKMIGFDLGYQF